MGGGCFRASTATEVAPSSPCRQNAQSSTASVGSAELKAQLKPLIDSVGRAASLSNTQLDGMLTALGEGDSSEVREYLIDWAGRTSGKNRAGLLVLLRRCIGFALDRGIECAEKVIRDRSDISGLEVSELARRCAAALTLDENRRPAVLAATLVLSDLSLAGKEGFEESPASFNVSSFDRFVLMFRHATLAHLGSSGSGLQAWQDLEQEIGYPPVEEHLSLLGTTAKTILLSLLLVPVGVKTSIIILSRDDALRSAGPQLRSSAVGANSDFTGGSVVSPYYESPTGSKIIQGRRVEGGEGHGPRKEFFIAASSDALRKWGAPLCSPPPSAPGEAPPVVELLCEGCHINVAHTSDASSAAEAVAQTLSAAGAGHRLRFQFADGSEEQRTVRATGAAGCGLTLDSPLRSEQPSATLQLRRCVLEKSVFPMFEFHRGTGTYWFSAYANDLSMSVGMACMADLRLRFNTFGKVLALALANRCKIAFALPLRFFQALVSNNIGSEFGGQTLLPKPSLEDVKSFDSTLYASLKKCLIMKQSDFDALKSMEGLPETTTREDYVENQVRSLLAPQALEEVRRGFRSIASSQALRGVSAADLQCALCPAERLDKATIDFRKIFVVVACEELRENEVFSNVFWSVVDGLTLEEKQRFLLFLTGVEAPPEPGAERMVIEMPFCAFTKDEHIAMLSKLPQSHTCSNTLELPNYHEAILQSGAWSSEQISNPKVVASELARVLGEKLRLAIHESTGYELDANEIDRHGAGSEQGLRPADKINQATRPMLVEVNEMVHHPFSADSHFMPVPVSAVMIRGDQGTKGVVEESGASAKDANKDNYDALLELSAAGVRSACTIGEVAAGDVDTLIAELELGMTCA